MFSGNSHKLSDIGAIGRLLPESIERKYALNFALTDGYELDVEKLLKWFDPKKFMVKITPYFKL